MHFFIYLVLVSLSLIASICHHTNDKAGVIKVLLLSNIEITTKNFTFVLKLTSDGLCNDDEEQMWIVKNPLSSNIN